MTVPQEDLDRLREYTDPDSATSQDDLQRQLDDAGFDTNSQDPIADAIAADSDIARDENALRQAQREAVDSLSDAGAVGGEIVRAEDGFTPIGKPENVEQRIERSGPETGDVIAVNQNTGSEGKIGEVDLVNPNRAID